jgi:hypothetical protein
MKRTLMLLLAIGCLVLASDEIPKRIEITKTDHADLPPGGAVWLKNSTGEITIEGWDQPGVEITTIKSTKLAYPAAGAERDEAAHMLEEVKVSEAMQDGQLVIATEFPRHGRFLPRPSVGARDFDLEYRVKVPREVKITVDNDAGEVHVDGLSGDIHATTNQGTITLRLPQTAGYSIDAKSRIGEVISDLPGTTTRKRFGHEFVDTAQAPHKLFLRNGYGDIIILRMRKPAPLP